MKERTYQTHMRLTKQERERIRRVAEREFRTMASWMRATLLRELERVEAQMDNED